MHRPSAPPLPRYHCSPGGANDHTARHGRVRLACVAPRHAAKPRSRGASSRSWQRLRRRDTAASNAPDDFVHSVTIDGTGDTVCRRRSSWSTAATEEAQRVPEALSAAFAKIHAVDWRGAAAGRPTTTTRTTTVRARLLVVDSKSGARARVSIGWYYSDIAWAAFRRTTRRGAPSAWTIWSLSGRRPSRRGRAGRAAPRARRRCSPSSCGRTGTRRRAS